MTYLKAYKSYINSQYFTEGIRMTAGILIPAFVMSFFGMLPTGIILSLGALFVSVTDSPGPIHHRRNGMLCCIASVFIVVVLTGLVSKSPVLLGFFLVAAGFFFSMINVYGARAASIGIASLLALTLNIDHGAKTPFNLWEQSVLMCIGGLWYICFSLLLYKFRPYRLIQQALGDYIQQTAEYLRIRANLYKKNVDYESTYTSLLQQQGVVQQKHNMLTELIFKTRSIVKDSTNVGRVLVMIHLEVADIFESIMMSHQRYSLLHQYFDSTDILDDYHSLALELADQLDEVGIAVKSGRPSSFNTNLREHVSKTREKREQLRLNYLKPDNIEGFISLRRILENIEDLAERLQILHQYTSYKRPVKKGEIKREEYKKLVTTEHISPGLFFDNLTFKSEIFRHSVRLSIAIIIGNLVSVFFKIGHSYWILLTIVVIVKPAYSLTKKRNKDRLAGTVAGVLIGLGVLYLVHNNIALLCIMIIFMAASYSFIRTNYFMSVLLMTPYLLLFYHLLHPTEFKSLLKDRVIDTAIGSAIAFGASLFLLPTWEREKITPLMIEMLTQAKNYFSVTADLLTGKLSISQQQLARKNALVALANLSDAFNRMLNEPKNRQTEVEKVHRFVVLSHVLTSYIATLAHYLKMKTDTYNKEEFIDVAEDIQQYLTNALGYLKQEDQALENIRSKDALHKLNDKVNKLLQKRKEEIQQGQLETKTKTTLFDLKSVVDQFNLIYNVVGDINKISRSMNI
jgi:uncharacterized membrane protein (TIGR01666 family)